MSILHSGSSSSSMADYQVAAATRFNGISSDTLRMRWTRNFHARFVHAVELLGGHERATPESVLELMDVKDLTLADVRSRLEMYRTLMTTDKPAASSDQSDGSGGRVRTLADNDDLTVPLFPRYETNDESTTTSQGQVIPSLEGVSHFVASLSIQQEVAIPIANQLDEVQEEERGFGKERALAYVMVTISAGGFYSLLSGGSIVKTRTQEIFYKIAVGFTLATFISSSGLLLLVHGRRSWTKLDNLVKLVVWLTSGSAVLALTFGACILFQSSYNHGSN